MSTINVNRVVDASGGVLAPISSVMRNRIINGAMTIAQRGTTFSGLSDDGGQYTLDRWRWSENGTYTGSQTVTQDSSAPVGFSNSLRVVTNTAITTGTSLSSRVEQAIEGFNSADLGWGTANAKTITLSFWVKSSLNGTFGGALRNADDNRAYPFSYVINAVDTWEYKSVTIAGDTTGTWGTTNGTGIRINFSLGAGTALSGTAGAWVAAGTQSVTGAVAVNATLNANWAVTGCQFEVGTQATSFEYRQYGQELALCQRYFYAFELDGLDAIPCWAQSANVTNCRMMMPITMRADPTITRTGTIGDLTKNWTVYNNGAFRTVNAIAFSGITNQSFRMEMTVDSGIAGADASGLYAANVGVGSPSLTASAEL